MNNKSFTLIELLVVIVIIGILAGVIVISTSSSIDKATLARGKTFYSTAKNNLLLDTLSEWSADYVVKNGSSWIISDQLGTKDGTFHDEDSVVCSSLACPQIVNDSQMGNVLSFDGINDYIFFSPLTGIDYEYSFTVWAYIENTTSGLIFKRAHCDGINLNNKKLNFWIKRNDHTSASVQSSNEVIVNEWNFIAITVSLKTKKITIYINGIETSNAISIDDTYPLMLSGGTSIGKGSGSSPDCPNGPAFKGKIKEFAIYNAYLTKAQVKKEYVTGLMKFGFKQ